MHNPTEHAQEHVVHEAAHGHGSGPKWITAAALTAAILAALAAVTAMLATTHLTESTQKRIGANDTRVKANDNWNFYQAKSIKSSEIDTRMQIWNVTPADKRDPITKQHDDDIKKIAEYATLPEKEKDAEKPQGMIGIQKKALAFEEEAKGLEGVSAKHLHTHETFEMSATMFHIAIAVVAIAVVAKRKEFWYMSMVGGVVGLYFFGSALAHAPHEAEHHGGEAGHAGAPHAGAAEPGHATGGEHAAPATGHAPASGESPRAPAETAPAHEGHEH